MKIANSFPQGSKNWFQWRSSGIGASEIAIILGISPFQTRFELWLEKTKLAARRPANQFALKAMVRGTLLEDSARQLFKEKTGKKVRVLSLVHPEHEFIRCSLDGLIESAEGNEILEIKAPGVKDHELAQNGEIPKKYAVQMQTQMLLADAVKGYYASYRPEVKDENDEITEAEDIQIIECAPDKDLQQQIVTECIDFWKLVKTNTAPDVTKKDVLNLVSYMGQLMDQQQQAMNTLDILAPLIVKGR